MDVLGVDIGGSTVKGARVDAGGAVLATGSCPTPSSSAALTGAVVSLAESLRSDTTVAVGVACPGVVDDGVVRFAANLPWRDEPVRDRLQAALGLPVVLCRDVAAAALAESAHVTGDDVLFVWLGTGIAAAHVVGGALRAGASGRAGELGHVPVHPDGEPCACGQRGCLEAYSSAASIARRYAVRTGGAATAQDVVARLGADADADAVWRDAVDALALALATDVLVNDPAVIVLGGGLAQAGDVLFIPLAADLQTRLAWRPAPPLVRATLGTSAGRLGAAQLAWHVVAPARHQEGTPS
jgi:glucokinase